MNWRRASSAPPNRLARQHDGRVAAIAGSTPEIRASGTLVPGPAPTVPDVFTRTSPAAVRQCVAGDTDMARSSDAVPPGGRGSVGTAELGSVGPRVPD